MQYCHDSLMNRCSFIIRSVPRIFLKTTCDRNALSGLLFVGSILGLMMNVNQYMNLLLNFPMNFRAFSIEYSLKIQCQSASCANSHKVILTSGGGSFSRAFVCSSYSSFSAYCSGIASSNFSAMSFDSQSRCAQHL